jgi:intracellular septation protein A
MFGASLLVNAVAPFVAYQVLSHFRVPTLTALAVTSLFPLAGLVLSWARNRRLDGIGLVTLVVIAIGLGALFLSHDPRLYLVNVSFSTGAFGAICLMSLSLRRPLMFYLGRQFSSGDDPVRLAEYDGLWRSASFRRMLREITLVWGLAYLVEAAVRAVIAWTQPAGLVLIASPLLAYGVLVLLLVWTMAYAGDIVGCGAGVRQGGLAR